MPNIKGQLYFEDHLRELKGQDWRFKGAWPAPQIIKMGGASKTMTYDTAMAGQVKITGQRWFVDAEGGAPSLIMPTEATSDGLVVVMFNYGGETILVRDDANAFTIISIGAGEKAVVVCDGTDWAGILI